ncbi:MAG: LytTR family DNA-binding domain-containing protein [Bacteroidota bacterium]
MIYKVAIVDDEEDARELIKIHLSRQSEMQVIGEAKNGAEAIELIKEKKPDIVLLDIQMPEFNGLEVVSALSGTPHFIFITAYDQFAVKAFELNAVDYLLKPFTDIRFDESLRRAKEIILQGRTEKDVYVMLLEEIKNHQTVSNQFIKRLAYKAGAKTSYINIDDIVMIEAADQYVDVHTKAKKYLLRQSMDYLEEMLDPQIFFRTHRSFIVRLSEVDSVEQYQARNLLVHLKNGKTVKLSSIRKQLFQNRLGIG